MKVRSLLILGFLTMASPLGAGERMVVKVTPAVSFSPANLIVRTTVEADAENRTLEISAESEDFYRSSEIQLDGDKAPRITQFQFRSLPTGTYDVLVSLRGSDGRPRAREHRTVEVLGSEAGR